MLFSWIVDIKRQSKVYEQDKNSEKKSLNSNNLTFENKEKLTIINLLILKLTWFNNVTWILLLHLALPGGTEFSLGEAALDQPIKDKRK